MNVSVSGNTHRRASVADLKAHYTHGSEKDHPAHWFAAQLTHYGLKPSNTKAVARMRLYDAVREDKLAIPPELQALEKEMKKDWQKAQREDSRGAQATDPKNPANTLAIAKSAQRAHVSLSKAQSNPNARGGHGER